MKFIEIIKMLKNKEENRNSILLVKCGVFFVAIDKDARYRLHEYRIKL